MGDAGDTPMGHDHFGHLTVKSCIELASGLERVNLSTSHDQPALLKLLNGICGARSGQEYSLTQLPQRRFTAIRLVQIKNFAIGQKTSVAAEEAIPSSIPQFDSKTGPVPSSPQRA